MSEDSRKSLRLSQYDYAQPGMYFVTLVTQGRFCCFGSVEVDTIIASPAGQMVVRWWNELQHKYPNVELDEYCIMPDHFHGILVMKESDYTIVRADLRVGPDAPAGVPLPVMMQWFKTMTTNAYIQGVKQSGWSKFKEKLWQRSYYDHIVRNNDDLDRIRAYIADNPRRWADDHENPHT